jgi:asparagine synthase (glutamine-hydrolysing)
MCGICGQFNFRSGAPVSQALVHQMTDTLVHRGPDDEGYFFSGPLGLGFRRLSIIDLACGHQPMSDAEESVWVVFNGEIYNFPTLKAELEGYGHIFRTRSDTEVIVHGYKQWGEEVLNHLNGMFGLAIWDTRRRKLVVARDAMGIKLVYYRVDGEGLTFGSEVRSILETGKTRPEVDPASLNLFLRYRFTPSPMTIYKGIRKLAPGTMLVCEDGECREVRWYKSKPKPFSPMPTVQEAKEELLRRYRVAVRRHLLSDVPVGLLLSGGVDSALLLALMREEGGSWPTFTVGYGSSFKDDELKDAALTAAAFGATHSSVELTREAFLDALPRIVGAVEEPIASSSVVPMYFVCRRARQDVKVVLMGQGPDELFGGYRRHLGVQYGRYWAAVPRFARSPMARALKRLPRSETLKRGLNSLDVPDRLLRYEHILSLVPEITVNGMFRPGVLPAASAISLLQCWGDLPALTADIDDLGGFQFLEVRSTLPDELLMYGDKLSMAHGLEARVPYLDREIVEWVEQLGASYKVRYWTGKWLHREVCRDVLPPFVLRRKKRGFAVNVVDQWFRDALGSRINGLLSDPSSLMYEFLSCEAVAGLLKEHVTGRQDNHKLLFSLVVFEQWLRERPNPSSCRLKAVV